MRNINKEELHEIFIEIANKNEEKFNQLYERYKSLVYAISFSILKNKEASEDVAQIVFSKIWNMKKENLPTVNEASWLYSLTKNETLNVLRKEKDAVSIDDVYYIKDDEDLNDITDKDMYNRIISKLDKKEQEIVSLKILSELSFREIAGILNMPIGTVQWKYYKALHTLKILIGNLSMFIVAITVFIANKTMFKNRKKVANEEVKQEEQEEYRKDEESTSKDNDNSQESTNKETEDIKENLKLENEMLGDNATNNEVKEQINVEEISNLNKIDIGILSVSGIFLTITIIFSIIFVKHQQNRKKKVSK